MNQLLLALVTALHFISHPYDSGARGLSSLMALDNHPR